MNQKLILLLVFITSVNLFLIGLIKTNQKMPSVVKSPVVLPPPPSILERTQVGPSKLIPKFENYPPVRSVNNLGKVLSDTESHLPAGHIYYDEDKITCVHEGTHGINSNARIKFFNNKKINAFYVLENRVVVIEEPNTRIKIVANKIPNSLRGEVYNLYLVQQASSWDDTPLYILDEWSAYVNGSACRLDLGIQNRSETVRYMLEFNVYSSCVAWCSGTNDPQLKAFLMWQIERAIKIYKDSGTLGNLHTSDDYLDKMRKNGDSLEWRIFCQQYFGADWCKEVLGF